MNENEESSEDPRSPQYKFARQILEQLRAELSASANAFDRKPVLSQLQSNGWWIRAADARDVMSKLSPASAPASWVDPFYLRDIHVHMPDVRWGEKPVCPTCLCSQSVGVHDINGYRLIAFNDAVECVI